MNHLLTKKMYKGIISLAMIYVCFSISEVYSQPPDHLLIRHDNKTDSLVKNSVKVKNTVADMIKLREEMENSQNFNDSNKDSLLKADDNYRKAVLKADAGDMNAAKELGNKVVSIYQSLIIKELLDGLKTNVKGELEASKASIGQEKYSDGIKKLDILGSKIKQYSAKNTSYSSLLEEINNKIKEIFENIGIKEVLPAYLKIGEFTIATDLNHIQFSKDFIHGAYVVTGEGRIQFCCDRLCKFVRPIYVRDASDLKLSERINEFNLNTVNKVNSPDKEILLEDACLIDPFAKVGSRVTVELLARTNKTKEIVQELENLLGNLKLPYAEGLLVKFDKLRVLSTSMKNIGLVIAGTAYYPASSLMRAKPITLNLPYNFKLEIDSLKITNGPCLAKAKLLLPKSLSRGDYCSSAWLDLGTFIIKRNCEFYKELPVGNYGPIEIGTTTMNISGSGYVVDFSSRQSYAAVTPDTLWKGVILLKGETNVSNDPIISNIGYLKAKYTFTNALVTSPGLKAVFNSIIPFNYKTLQPSGYDITFNVAQVVFDSSDVREGFLRNGSIALPNTSVVDQTGLRITAVYNEFRIYRNRSIYGEVNPPVALFWGEFTSRNLKTYGATLNQFSKGFAYFSGQPRAPYLPVSDTVFHEKISPITFYHADSICLSGVTFNNLVDFYIFTPDVLNPALPLVFFNVVESWVNILTDGVNAFIKASGPNATTGLGPVNSPQYACPGQPFVLLGVTDPSYTHHDQNSKIPNFIAKFVTSAVFTSKLKDYIKLDGPSKIDLAFNDMLFTSTANNAGGKVDLSSPDTLDFWGVALVQKPGFNSGGLISVKTGQIILSAAGLAENRHFLKPFYLIWGEMLATGDMGRLFFDYNSLGQQFDGFNFVPYTLALSKYNVAANAKGFLKAAGDAHFPFFGGNYLNLNDWKCDTSVNPYNKRRIELCFTTDFNTLPSDTVIAGNWASNFGTFNYFISYSASDQNGFIGTGTAGLQYVPGGTIASTIVLKSIGQCISLKDNVVKKHSLAFGPVANFGATNSLWGCACIVNNQIQELVLGGEISQDINVSAVIRSAGSLTFTFMLKPSVSKLTLDGMAYLSLAASFDVEANGHFALTVDNTHDFIDGDISAKLKIAAFLSSSVEADGEVNWHFGGAADHFHQSVQGIAYVHVLGISTQGGFYVGINAPKSNAWVLFGANPKYRLNTSAMPDYLTGVYGFVQYEEGFDFFLFSGGFDVFAGVGVFFLTPAQVLNLNAKPSGLDIPVVPYIVGNLGGGIHGEILAGFVSASASVNLQIMAPYPGSFEGTFELEGCVFWIACASVDITAGLNTSDGLYIK